MATMKELQEFVIGVSNHPHEADCRLQYGHTGCRCISVAAQELLDNKHEFSYVRNFKEFWKEHLFGHIPVGLLIGLTFNIPLAMLVAKRQELEYEKRDDTPGIDMAYHVGSVAAGIVILMMLVGFIIWRLYDP